MSIKEIRRSSGVEANKIEHFAQSEYQGQYQQVILPISNHLHDYSYHHAQPLVTSGHQYYSSSRQANPVQGYHYGNEAYYHPPTQKTPKETLPSNLELLSDKVLPINGIEKQTRTDELYCEDQIVNVERADPKTLATQVSASESTAGNYYIKKKVFFINFFLKHYKYNTVLHT